MFSVIGLTVALSFDAHPLIAVMMAVMTSIAGGIMRDMICNEIPLVLQKRNLYQCQHYRFCFVFSFTNLGIC